jgi:hypothetical protein
MVTHYEYGSVKSLINSNNFLSNYNEYKFNNAEKIDALLEILSSITINKNYYKMNISSKNVKFKKNLSTETLIIKNIHNLLNKLTSDNLNNITNKIISEIKNTKYLIPNILDIIIDKCINEIQYNDLYIKIIHELLKLDKTIKLDLLINNKMKIIYVDFQKKETDYLSLCSMNKNIDNFIGLSILIIKLEINKLLNNYSNKIINIMFDNIILDNDEICYKYILSLYNIFSLLKKENIIIYKDKINNIKNENICKKNKFKLMDILDLMK